MTTKTEHSGIYTYYKLLHTLGQSTKGAGNGSVRNKRKSGHIGVQGYNMSSVFTVHNIWKGAKVRRSGYGWGSGYSGNKVRVKYGSIGQVKSEIKSIASTHTRRSQQKRGNHEENPQKLIKKIQIPQRQPSQRPKVRSGVLDKCAPPVRQPTCGTRYDAPWRIYDKWSPFMTTRTYH